MKLLQPQYSKGYIVNTNDPLCLDRVQVRVVGLHPSQTSEGTTIGIPNDALPWYQLARPSSAGSISGVGSSGVGSVQQGQEVLVMFLDEWCREGYVVNTLPTNPDTLARRQTGMNGFSDPTGTFPLRVGSSTANAAAVALGAENNAAARSISLNKFVAPSQKNISWEENLDDDPIITPSQMLAFDEGVRNIQYWDSLGYPTIGIGHLIVRQKTRDIAFINRKLSEALGREITTTGTAAAITDDDVQKLFSADLAVAARAIDNYPLIAAAFNAANKSRQFAIINMCFQMGHAGLNKFTTSLTLMAQGKWKEAAVELGNSNWAKQTPSRSYRVRSVIASGNMNAYGVRPPEPKAAPSPAELVDKVKDSMKVEVPKLKVRLMTVAMSSPVVTELSGSSTIAPVTTTAVNSLIRQNITTRCSSVIADAKETVLETTRSLLTAYYRKVGIVASFIDAMVDSVVEGILMAKLAVVNTLEKIADFVKDFVQPFIDYAQSVAKAAHEWAKEKAEAFVEYIKGRANEELEAYPRMGIECIDGDTGSTGGGAVFRESDNDNPWDPAKPDNSTVMWKEDDYKTFANPEYTKNDVKTTISGHLQEFDDTPGFERVNLQHASGTRTTFTADGGRHLHTQGNSKDAVKESRYLGTGGNKQEYVGGECQTYIVGDNIITIDGDGKLSISGNSEITILGDQKVNIKGNQLVTIEGNQEVSVKGNVVINVIGTTTVTSTGDVTLNAEANVAANVKGNMTQMVEGDYNVTAANISLIAKGQWTADGSRIDIG